MYKVCCVIVGVVMFLPLWALAQSSAKSAPASLAALRDRSRPLIVFFPESTDSQPLKPSLQRQQALLEGHESQLKDRDVEVLLVPYRREGESASSDIWKGLRSQFHIDSGKFTVVLVGKDGGEKFRSHVPVTIEKLTALIDAMPMRQQEVRDGHPE